MKHFQSGDLREPFAFESAQTLFSDSESPRPYETLEEVVLQLEKSTEERSLSQEICYSYIVVSSRSFTTLRSSPSAYLNEHLNICQVILAPVCFEGVDCDYRGSG